MSTAICTHILAERGKLRLLDPVSLYIPEFKSWVSEDGKDKKIIRIADLLTHTSGLPPYAPTSELEKQYGSPSPDGMIEYIANCRRDFKPQTDFQYSCLNYITLQRIIETVSGQSLRDFARENLFDVLGMAHTDYLPCKRDKNGKWINTALPHWAEKNSQLSTLHSQLIEVAPTEKQSDGSVLCGQVHDPTRRCHEWWYFRQCRRILLCRRHSCPLRRPAKRRRMERTPHPQPIGSKSYAYRPPCHCYIRTHFRMG